MPWQTPVTVTARVVLRGDCGSGQGCPCLKFLTLLEFKTAPEDPEDTFDIKNVRYAWLVGDPGDWNLLNKVAKSRHPIITITGSFEPQTTVHQPGPPYFDTSDLRAALERAPRLSSSRLALSLTRLQGSSRQKAIGKRNTSTRRGAQPRRVGP